MNKKQFAQELLTLFEQFLQSKEEHRKKIGKLISSFYLKNHKFDNGREALTDSDFQLVGIAAELNEYNKYTFREEDILTARKVLEKIVRKNIK